MVSMKGKWRARGAVAMDRAGVLARLAQSKSTLAGRYRVTRLALFGSAARDGSDIDILVAFDGPATAERYFGVQSYLEDLFGVAVDLVTEKGLRAELRPFIEAAAIGV